MESKKSDIFVSHAEARRAEKARPKKWMGSKPETCNLCSRPLQQQFIDGRTAYGYWAIMCVHCHRIVGCGLGTGNGQRYDLITLEKVEG